MSISGEKAGAPSESGAVRGPLFVRRSRRIEIPRAWEGEARRVPGISMSRYRKSFASNSIIEEVTS